jgi:hypothetical protein
LEQLFGLSLAGLCGMAFGLALFYLSSSTLLFEEHEDQRWSLNILCCKLIFVGNLYDSNDSPS